jgi:peptide/nickel transport system permease protein
VVLALVVLAALAAPWMAPNDPNQRFDGLLFAPPTRVHLFGEDDTFNRGGAPEAGTSPAAGTIADPSSVRGPHIHQQRVVSLRARTFIDDPTRAVPLRWFADGRVVTADPGRGAPLLLLGADGLGRDIFARLLHGARATLLVAAIATVGATLLGAVIGGVSGQSAGWVDAALSRVTEFVLVLPAIYVALSLRAVMPLVLSSATVFLLLTGIFTLLGWPVVARGVRAIVVAERERDYAQAARAAGAGRARLLFRHLMPAASGYVTTQATLLFPAFILAEATMSFVGLGFPSDVATWGTMLRDAQNVAALADAPWTLAPALAIFTVVLGVNLFVQGSGHTPVQLEP